MSSADPCDPTTLVAADGARLVSCAHGGHLLGWTPAGGTERLWLSRDARCGPGAAIRGGVPVIWPQFAGRGPLPKHGLARDRAWRRVPGVVDGGAGEAAEVGYELVADDDTRTLWPYDFGLRLVARASGDRLDLELTVHGDSAAPLAFTAALHAYLAVSDVAAVRLRGLAGCTAEDSLTGGSSTVPDGPMPAVGPRDLVVRDVRGPVVLEDPALGPLTLTAEGFPDRVVWNPGPGRAPEDVHPGGEAEFVCVEPARVTPLVVPAGEHWTGSVALVAGHG